MSQTETVTFKLSTIDLISLDAHVKTKNINRSEFIKIAINEKINKARLEQEAKREGSDLQKVYQALTEMNATVNEKLDKQNINLKTMFERDILIKDLLLHIIKHLKIPSYIPPEKK
jgi:metal-responsive CopG/Arc/MetJ family transcriptional regulator